MTQETEMTAPDLRDQFARYIRTGSAPDQGDPSGGYVVPQETEDAINRRLLTTSPMRDISTVRSVSSGTFRKPVSMTGNDPATLALLEFPAADLYANPAATQALLDDALVDLDEWLASEVEDAFAAQETTAFVTGDGVNKPKGFLAYELVPNDSHAWGQIGTITGDIDVDRLIDLVYAPKAQYRPNGRFVMNRKTVSAVRKFKDADGNYIWSPATRAGETASLLGYPIIEIEAVPDEIVAFGDFQRGYLIVDRSGVRVLRDPYSAKPYVLFYTTKRVGGGVQNFDAIKVLGTPRALRNRTTKGEDHV
jgi:HK97 family phage major capsid protein